MIAAGRRDKYVGLSEPGGSMPDGEGGYTEGWIPLDPPNVYIRLNPASQADMEQAAAGTTVGLAMFTVDMDYHPQVTIKTRIEYDDPDRGLRFFQISSVRDPEEAKRWLMIVAQELLP